MRHESTIKVDSRFDVSRFRAFLFNSGKYFAGLFSNRVIVLGFIKASKRIFSSARISIRIRKDCESFTRNFRQVYRRSDANHLEANMLITRCSRQWIPK